jgi:nitroreductase
MTADTRNMTAAGQERDPAPLMDLERLLTERHSCRGFLPQPLPPEIIEHILRVAQRTASWCNAQPWHVHVVSGAALERLRSALFAGGRDGAPVPTDIDWPREYQGIYRDRRRECGWSLYEAVGVGQGDREGAARQARENFRLFGAPHLAVVTAPEALGTYGVMDCGAWVANFLLAATALGVASIPQAAIASRPDVLRAHLEIPADRRIVCGISFGYEDTAHPANHFRTTRAPLAECVNWVA